MNSTEVSQKFTTGTFAFTGTSINSLESTEYTVTGLALDISGSIGPHVAGLRDGLKEVIRSCQSSPRSDNLVIRLLTFGQGVKEFHGFKELNKCVLSDYDHILDHLEGSTALYDGSVDIIESVSKYGEALYGEDYTANGLVVVLTDGMNNFSTYTAKTVGEKLSEAAGERKLESLVSILVGVGTSDPMVKTYLADFARQAGFSQYIDLEKADAKTLAKLANFISRSISSQSSSLGTGQAAPSLTF